MALFGARDATKGKPAGGTHRLSGLINTPLVAQFYLLCGNLFRQFLCVCATPNNNGDDTCSSYQVKCMCHMWYWFFGIFLSYSLVLTGEYSYALFLEDVTEFAQQEDGVMTLEEAFRFLEQMA